MAESWPYTWPSHEPTGTKPINAQAVCTQSELSVAGVGPGGDDVALDRPLQLVLSMSSSIGGGPQA